MRRCTRCGTLGKDTLFAIRTKVGTGLCKRCKAQYNADWYRRNTVSHKENVARNESRYENEREQGLRPKRKRTKEQAQSYRQKRHNKGLCRNCKNERKASSSLCDSCSQCLSKKRSEQESKSRRDPTKTHIILYKDSRRSAQRKSLEHDLTPDQIHSLISTGCMYCGETELRMSLDRKDNNQGYVSSNVNPCCIRCNFMRGSMPYPAWVNLLPLIRDSRERGLFGDWKPGPRSSAEERSFPKRKDARANRAGGTEDV